MAWSFPHERGKQPDSICVFARTGIVSFKPNDNAYELCMRLRVHHQTPQNNSYCNAVCSLALLIAAILYLYGVYVLQGQCLSSKT